jgi:hypothetical protein
MSFVAMYGLGNQWLQEISGEALPSGERQMSVEPRVA